MAYTITLTNGNIYNVIPDGTTIQASNYITLVGKNYAGYGQFLNDNYIRLLENGANSVPPGAPLVGQLWFNTAAGVLQVYNGAGFKTLSGATAQASAPSNNNVGDLWFDTGNQQLKIWTGATSSPPNQWLLVGPQFTSGTGQTGAFASTISDGTNNQGTLVGIISKDTTFTPSPSIVGFANISPGIQLTTAGNTAYFQGTAVNALNLGGQPASAYLTSNAASFAGGITVNTGGSAATAIVNGAGNGIGNIGSTSSYFNTIFAKSTSSQYADVAERFHADTVYEAGTVVELGGPAEITYSKDELSDSVFGVISTRAAYLMNSGAGSDETHPPVAMTGRVPVRVVGTVNKGDRLVSAGNGLARAAKPGEITAFNVIGRSLVDKKDTIEGLVEAIVTIK
jgi:hypothetical protein